MNYKEFSFMIIVAVVFTVFIVFYVEKITDTVAPATVASVKETVVLEEVIKTSGNWSFIPFDDCDPDLGFDFSSVPEIIDRFERGHQDLLIKDWGIVHDTFRDGPRGILIRHTPK